jgi:AraC family transcriptional regulator
MPRIIGHGKAKYITGVCLGSSRDRAWPGLLAERWQHSEGDLGEIRPRETEVIVMLEGRLRVRRRGDGQLQQHQAVPGTVWLCPAGIREDMIHLYGDIRESIHLYLPAVPLATTALEDLDVDPSRVRLHYAGGFRDPLIEAIGRTVAGELRNPSPMAPLLVETLSAALGVYILRSYSDIAPSRPLPTARGTLDGRRLARVLAFIDANLDRDLTLEELAREACLSAFHFARSFKAATGTSPHRYLLQRRIDHAKALLSDRTPLSLAEVALACGFSSQAHFSTSFKQATGVSPSLFARF